MIDVLPRPPSLPQQTAKDVARGRNVWPSLDVAVRYNRVAAVPHLVKVHAYKNHDSLCEALVTLLCRADGQYGLFAEHVAMARWIHAHCGGDALFRDASAECYAEQLSWGVQHIAKWRRPASDVREALTWFVSITHNVRPVASLSAEVAPALAVRVSLGDLEMARWLREFASVERVHIAVMFELAVDCSVTRGRDETPDDAHVAALEWLCKTYAITVEEAREMANAAVRKNLIGAARMLLVRARGALGLEQDLCSNFYHAARSGHVDMLVLLKESIDIVDALVGADLEQSKTLRARAALFALQEGYKDAATWIVDAFHVQPLHFDWRREQKLVSILCEFYGAGCTDGLAWLDAHCGLAVAHTTDVFERVCVQGRDGVRLAGPEWMRARFGVAHQCSDTVPDCAVACGASELYEHFLCASAGEDTVEVRHCRSLRGTLRAPASWAVQAVQMDAVVAAPVV